MIEIRAVVQRVTKSQVTVDNEIVGRIDNGLMVLLGVASADGDKEIEYLANKIINLRIFEDENGKMNLSLKDVHGRLLIVSQFTLYGDCRKGNRPSFVEAAPPDKARDIYLKFVEYCKESGVEVQTGQFQAKMLVEIHNEGPVTLIVESKS